VSAAGMKLVPALFIVYLLLTHRLRAAAWAAGAFAATVATGFAVMPPAAGKYWTRYVFDTARAGPTGYVGNPVAARRADAAHGDSDHMRITWLIFCLVVVMAGLWIAVRLHGRDRELAAICAVALTGLLVSPISWQHHWSGRCRSPCCCWSVATPRVARGGRRPGPVVSVLLRGSDLVGRQPVRAGAA